MQMSDVVDTHQQCPVCAETSCPLPQEDGRIRRGEEPLTCWQVDYIGPLPHSEGSQYALTCVDTMGLLQAYPSGKVNQRATIWELWQLCASYNTPEVTESDQATHFTGHLVQDWAESRHIDWQFHPPYNSTRAGLIE